MYDIKYITPDLGSVCGQYYPTASQPEPERLGQLSQYSPVTILLRDSVTVWQCDHYEGEVQPDPAPRGGGGGGGGAGHQAAHPGADYQSGHKQINNKLQRQALF